MNSSPAWKGTRDDIATLAGCTANYAAFLDEQNKLSKELHDRNQAVQTLEDISVEYRLPVQVTEKQGIY